MTVREPESMTELVYFTNRTLDNNGVAKLWVYRQDCPKCKKTKMGKPVDKGKVKIRAKEFVCPSCRYTVEKEEYESGLTAQAIYTCPKCRKQGEAELPFKWKNVDGVKALKIACSGCKQNILITKKMKEKGASDEGEDE
ncbi:hypothetical protein HY772_06035 [Candidatus Woesearchaeota archaeon]|nr:hypothetical protein [Candidatus Woesearchaeota archaeon]